MVIKKSNLDLERLNNYRSASNLPTLLKIIEKRVVAQIKDHMLVHGLDENMQSAYKNWHSTKRRVDGNRWTEGCDSGPIRFIGGVRHHLPRNDVW